MPVPAASIGNIITTVPFVYTVAETTWPTIVTTSSACSDNTVYWIGHDTAGRFVPSRSAVMTNVGAVQANNPVDLTANRVAIEMAQAMRQQVAFDQQAFGAGIGVQQAGYAQQCLSNQLQGQWPTQSGSAATAAEAYAHAQQQQAYGGWYDGSAEERIVAFRREQEEQMRRHQEASLQRAKAESVAEKLLLSALTDEQQEQYKKSKYFEVTSKTSRRRYRISYGWAGNVFVFDEKGRQVEKLCIHPSVQVPVPDHLLAQKFMLECDEEGFRRTANITKLAA